MPGGLQDVILQAGVNSQYTKALNTAGVVVSNLIRFKSGLVEKIGGWDKYYPYQISTAAIRDLHAFQSLRGQNYLGIGALDKLVVVSCGLLTDLTPQGFQTNPAPAFTVTSGSNVVLVHDPGSSMTAYSSVRFDTPVAIDGLLLNGAYLVNSVVDINNYTILASGVASASVSSGGILPKFWVSSGTGIVSVELPNNNFLQVVGLFYPFRAPTSVGGLTIQGGYQLYSIQDSTDFQIAVPGQASGTVSSAAPVTMNGGNASLYHYVTVGAPLAGGVYGAGNYGAMNYGLGTPSQGGTATPIIVSGWTLDNWGQNFVACQQNGPIFIWAPDIGFSQAQPIVSGNAPLFNYGAFVAQPFQIMFAYGSCHQSTGQQDPLLIRWSDIAALQGYSQWNATTQTYAGSFRIPTGSKIISAIQSPPAAIFFTDVDVWTAVYIGQPLVYSFLRQGYGCGIIGQHACCVQNGVVFWAGQANFYSLTSNGVQVLACSVWDFFFQQIDTANQGKVECAANSAFSEVAWYFPVIGGNGENQAYVKVHIEGSEYQWDYGYLDRAAWSDISLLGMPIAADSSGFVQQHETAPDGNSLPINAAVETGYFEIGDGTKLGFVDWILPDAKWETFGGSTSAILMFTFFTADYAGQTERVYGPYAVSQQIPYINTRMRGRFWRCRIESTDLGSFWRVGKISFRWAPAGQR